MKKAVIYILTLLACIYMGKAFAKTFHEVNAAEVEDIAETTPSNGKYELMIDNVTWPEAAEKATLAGGHLVTINNEEERNIVIDIFENSGLQYCWLGASRGEDGYYHWVTDEPFQAPWEWWAEGEPSGKDADGTVENCMCLWLDGLFNDVRDDLSGVVGDGQIGYIVEYE